MAAIRMKTNIGAVSQRILEKLDVIKNKEYLLRPVCFDLIDLMTKRIHVDGKNAAEQQIGTYSKGYMALRTGNFKNSKKITRGKNKGKNKDAGVVSKRRVATPFGKSSFAVQNIESEGIPREQYNRSSDTKIIVSLTRQLENDWNVIATEKGYGVGFLNSFNLQKARWVEENKGQKIFSLSKPEQDHALARIQELVKQALNDQ